MYSLCHKRFHFHVDCDYSSHFFLSLTAFSDFYSWNTNQKTLAFIYDIQICIEIQNIIASQQDLLGMEINKKQLINLAILGQSKSGKSTLSGHLLSVLAHFPLKQQILPQIQDYAKINPKIKYSWIMNTLKQQRDTQQTIQTTSKRLETDKFNFCVIDVPGKKNYIKNMMTGATQADCCILVVDPVGDNLEIGFGAKGEAKDHGVLAFAFGIKQIIVAVNKMDEVEYKEQKYENAKKFVMDYLKKVGFETKQVPFIPISALEGDNLFKLSEKMPWYKQATLVQAMNQLTPIKRQQNQPLRISIQKVYNIAGVGTVPKGKIESGVLKKGMKIVIAPSGWQGEVKTIERNKESVEQGNPGEIIGIGFTNTNFEPNIKKGYVIGQVTNNPPKAVESFLAQVVIINHPKAISKKSNSVMQCHSAYFPCKIETILSSIDRRTGQTIEQNPNKLENGDCAMVVFKPQKPISCQPFTEFPSLGRFVVRDNHCTVAVGVIKKCQKKEVKV